MPIVYAGKTDVGKKRDSNQDNFSIKNLSDELVLCTVCDGMGGANGGSTASVLAQSVFDEYVEKRIDEIRTNPEKIPEILQAALDKANEAVFSRSEKEAVLQGMGTTLVSCLCDGKKYYCITVGDSRIYAIGKKSVNQLSHDHSYVQRLVDSGAITADEARVHPNRNIITKAVGTEKGIVGDVFTADAASICGLLLCSDGLCGYLDHKKIEKICLENKEPEKCAAALVEAANFESGADNITAVVIKSL